MNWRFWQGLRNGRATQLWETLTLLSLGLVIVGLAALLIVRVRSARIEPAAPPVPRGQDTTGMARVPDIDWSNADALSQASTRFRNKGISAAARAVDFRAACLNDRSARERAASQLISRSKGENEKQAYCAILELADIWAGQLDDHVKPSDVPSMLCRAPVAKLLNEAITRRRDRRLRDWCVGQLNRYSRELFNLRKAPLNVGAPAWNTLTERVNEFADCARMYAVDEAGTLIGWIIRDWPREGGMPLLQSAKTAAAGLLDIREHDMACQALASLISARLQSDTAEPIKHLSLLLELLEPDVDDAFIDSMCRRYSREAGEQLLNSLQSSLAEGQLIEAHSRTVDIVTRLGDAPEDMTAWRAWVAAKWCRDPESRPHRIELKPRRLTFDDTPAALVAAVCPTAGDTPPTGNLKDLAAFVKDGAAVETILEQVPTGWVELGRGVMVERIEQSLRDQSVPLPSTVAPQDAHKYLTGLLIAAYAPLEAGFGSVTPAKAEQRDRYLARILWSLELSDPVWWAALDLWEYHTRHEPNRDGSLRGMARLAGSRSTVGPRPAGSQG